MPEHNPGQMGGTMRLGKRRTIFKTNNSVLRKQKPLHMLPLWEILPAPPISPAVLYTACCLSGKLYGDVEHVDERHRHRYEVCFIRLHHFVVK